MFLFVCFPSSWFSSSLLRAGCPGPPDPPVHPSTPASHQPLTSCSFLQRHHRCCEKARWDILSVICSVWEANPPRGSRDLSDLFYINSDSCSESAELSSVFWGLWTVAIGELSRLHANMGALFFSFFSDAEKKTTFVFPLFFDGDWNIASGQDFSLCLPTHTVYFNFIPAIWALKRKRQKEEIRHCCSSITVKPLHFFLVLVMSTFADLLLFVVVLSENGSSYLFKISLLKSTFKCVLKLNNSVIVHCKYCYSLIKMYQSCYEYVRLPSSCRESEKKGECVCEAENIGTNTHFDRQNITENCRCVSTGSTLHQDAIFTQRAAEMERLPVRGQVPVVTRHWEQYPATNLHIISNLHLTGNLINPAARSIIRDDVFPQSFAIDRAVCWLLWGLLTQIFYSCYIDWQHLRAGEGKIGWGSLNQRISLDVDFCELDRCGRVFNHWSKLRASHTLSRPDSQSWDQPRFLRWLKCWQLTSHLHLLQCYSRNTK